MMWLFIASAQIHDGGVHSGLPFPLSFAGEGETRKNPTLDPLIISLPLCLLVFERALGY